MTGQRDPAALLERAGIGPDPDQDQHFLLDERVLDRLPGYLPEDRPTGPILEIGAGTGALTDRLLSTGVPVEAIERDTRLVAFLEAEFAEEIGAGQLTIHAGDALEVTLPDFGTCVSNLPYGIASPILFRLLPERRPLVVTVQREFAERMVAEPGTSDYGRLSVSSQHFAAIEIIETIPPTAFRPQPAVESAVVRTRPREPSYSIDDEAFFLTFVKALFTQRRKTLRNAIRNTTHISGVFDPDAVLEAVDEELLGKRPDAVTPAEFARLTRAAMPHR